VEDLTVHNLAVMSAESTFTPAMDARAHALDRLLTSGCCLTKRPHISAETESC